ncbi:membrane protein insertase YidC [Bacillus alkalicellulosilyticus]|uniref:membrane protein insertase YidC n=1 Tax=Alkalihalobacterium alkalicellulosilyticum TaxID=1912214 RepID=UPI0009960C1F|nr:membrane protein insertase YidC [Bacillus alkalicellulosilyticus]
MFTYKKIALPMILLTIVLLVSGCGGSAEPITADTTGIWNHYFIFPLSWVLTSVANIFDGNYGLSIVLVTIMIRLALFPLTLKQTRSSKAMMALKPDMDAIKQKYSGKSKEEQQKMQLELVEVYKKHGINPVAGCLPLFIQMPILLAFYYAIMRTEEIAAHTFLWFDLGQTDPLFLLPIIAATTTYFQAKLSMKQGTEQFKLLIYIMPGMILVAALAMPSALALYWVVGNLFMIVQTYFLFIRNSEPIDVKA